MSDDNNLSNINVQSEGNLASEYALRVALQTMKERCIFLQDRLTVVENENLVLKLRSETEQSTKENHNLTPTECDNLRVKLADLTRQKHKLTEHIAMISAENRQLWSRLSQLTKEKTSQRKESDNLGHTKLIRSETFTQYSPSASIRLKHLRTPKDTDELAMEEVPLKAIDDFCLNKSDPKNLSFGTKDLEFGYLNDDVTKGDIIQDANKCNEGIQNLKSELMKQQTGLKRLLHALKDGREITECPQCKLQRPEMTDKCLSTDECKKDSTDLVVGKELKEECASSVIEQKKFADSIDKMCPLCGKIYSSEVPFDNFREHVETHFVDENEHDSALEMNYEFISHTVGNF